jgi:hypothetical protein
MLPSFPFGVKLESLLTDFHSVERISPRDDLDGNISIQDERGDLAYEWHDDRVIFKGPFPRYQNQASDPRYTLWGNQGFLYRYALYLLEKKHNIFNFHACALYHQDRDALYLIIGGAGSGKTVYLLSGLKKGLKLFATETVHFQMDMNDTVWYMGSVVDNVRYSTLMQDFPQYLPEGEVPDPQTQWHDKVAIDLSAFGLQKEILKNPGTIHILFPRIEKGFASSIWNPVKDTRQAVKVLFDNITQKLAETTLLYDELMVLGLDRKDLARTRFQAVQKLADHPSISEISVVLSNPKDCWGNILE